MWPSRNKGRIPQKIWNWIISEFECSSYTMKKLIVYGLVWELHPTQIISRGNLYPNVIHLEISAYINNEIQQGNFKVSFEKKQNLMVNALQKHDPRLVKLETWQIQDLLVQLLRTWDFTGRKNAHDQSCHGRDWDQQMRTGTHWALLGESHSILANAFFPHHRMGK